MKVDSRSACQRHITVTIPREDIDRYFDKEFSELMANGRTCRAFAPGARRGSWSRPASARTWPSRSRASLLMDSLTQVNEEQKLSAISEPDFDLEAVEMPDEGPMTFEFDLEVRPEFDLPKWKGLTIERPVREFTDDGRRPGAARACWPAAAGWCRSTGRPSRATTSPRT